MQWLDSKLEVPVEEGTWKQIMYMISLLPMDDANYGDVEFGLAYATQDGSKTFACVQGSSNDAQEILLRFADGTKRPAVLDSTQRTVSVGSDDTKLAYEASVPIRSLACTASLIPRACSHRRRCGSLCSGSRCKRITH